MQIVPTSLLAVVLCGLLLLRGPYRGLWAFMASLPFGAAAAFNLPAIGGTSVLVSDIALLALFALLFARRGWLGETLGTLRPYRAGFWLLLALIGAVLSAVFLPRLFSGQTEVFQIVRYDGKALAMLQPLRPSSSNIAQAFRLLLSASAFLTLATLYRRRPAAEQVVKAMALATLVHAGLSAADLLSHAAGLPDLLSHIRTSSYQMLDNQILLGAKRLVGGFPEPSSFGYYTIGLFGFWLRYWSGGLGDRKALLCLLIVTLLALRSTSSGTYASMLLFCTVFLCLRIRGIRPDRLSRTQTRVIGGLTAALLLLAAAMVLALNLLPAAGQYADQVLLSKLSSDSGVERMSWNRQAFVNFWETWTFGAGLGSVRGNGWLGASLGSLGLAGTFCFGAFLLAMARLRVPADRRSGGAGGQAERTAAALQYGCGAVFIQAMLTKGTPNLGTEFFAMAGLAFGISRGLQLAAGQVPEVQSCPVFRQPGGVYSRDNF